MTNDGAITRVTEMVQHYGTAGLLNRLRAALTQAGLDEKPLTPADLAPLDHFHTRGIAATAELAQAVGIERGSRVLDIGSGLGGPSRYLAATFGCHVTGIDLNPSFVEAATYLTARAGLAAKVSYQVAHAEALPFSDGNFDIAWTQHVAMNVADRTSMYREVFRVVRTGGRFAIYDVLSGNGQALHFPVPWARAPKSSFLVTPLEMRTLLEEQGFRIVDWADRTEAGLAWFSELQKAGAQTSGTPPALGLHVAMGPAGRASRHRTNRVGTPMTMQRR